MTEPETVPVLDPTPAAPAAPVPSSVDQAFDFATAKAVLALKTTKTKLEALAKWLGDLATKLEAAPRNAA